MEAASDDSRHFRFCIYRVENPGEHPTIRYRTSTGDWDSRFSKAMLWDDLDFTKGKAEELIKIMRRHPPAMPTNIVIGREIVAACPFFANIVMGQSCKE